MPSNKSRETVFYKNFFMRHPEKYIDVYIVRLTSLQYYSVKLGVPT